MPDAFAYMGSTAICAREAPEKLTEPCVTPMRFMRLFIREVLASHWTGSGIVLSSPVSGMDPGSKAIDAIELPARRSLRWSSYAYRIVQSFEVE